MPVTALMLALVGRVVAYRAKVPEDLLRTHAAPVLDMRQLVGVFVVIAVLHFSWTAFWAGSLILLCMAAYSVAATPSLRDGGITPATGSNTVWVIVLGLACALLTLSVSRSDLDDGYYVAAAAYAASHPHAPLLVNDPMFGEAGWPLFFSSYRFSAYEPFAAVIAKVAGIPAMDVMYRVLPPFAGFAIVGSVFFCSREMFCRWWIGAGTAAVILMLILGEELSSVGNFGFVRIFQGKALFLSIMVPLIYGLSFRYARQGRPFDLYLLVCAQITSIGLTNFGMLGAPMAGAVASISACPPITRDNLRKIFMLACTTCVAIPYLVFVAVCSHGAGIFAHFDQESASKVWTGIYGAHQQFLVAFLLLIGPFVANTPLLRWRMALPPLILLGVLLNPVLAPWISRYVTTAPVYWRVTWSFPVVIYLGVSISLLFDRLARGARLVEKIGAGAGIAGALSLATIAIPYGTLRSANQVTWQFASRKLELNAANAAEEAIALTPDGRVLGDDRVGGTIAMYEEHPPLVNVRSIYIDFLAPYMSHRDYLDRKILAQYVNGEIALDGGPLKSAVDRLNVHTIVIADNLPFYEADQHALTSAGFLLKRQSGAYTVWTRNY